MSASERPRDKGGSHPENQLKRVELRKARGSLVALLALVALGAIGFAAVRRSANLDLAAGYLGGSGLTVALLLGGAHALAGLFLVAHVPRARLVAGLAASLMIVTSIAMLILAVGSSWVPATLFLVGMFELLLVAGSTPRKPAHRKHVPGT